MLTNLFIKLGWSRDDWKWLFLQIASVAALISSNVFDVPYWADYLGIPLSPTVLHWIFGSSALILWIAGRYNSSPLPSGQAMASGVVKGSPAERLPVLVLLIVLAGGSFGCATSTGRRIATVSAVAAHATLAAVQDTEMALVCGRPTAPQPPACVPAAQHQEISAKLVEAFTWDGAVATTIRDWPATGGSPVGLGALLAQITATINYVLDHLPEGVLTTKLLATLGGRQ